MIQFDWQRGVSHINQAKLEHLGCLLEEAALHQCFRFVWWYLKCIRGYTVISNYIIPLLFSLLQLTKAILENPKDKTKVHLIYANTTFEDILLKVCFSIYSCYLEKINILILGFGNWSNYWRTTWTLVFMWKNLGCWVWHLIFKNHTRKYVWSS